MFEKIVRKKLRFVRKILQANRVVKHGIYSITATIFVCYSTRYRG